MALNIGQLSVFSTQVNHPETKNKIKEAISIYVNGDEAKAREQLRSLVDDLRSFGYGKIADYLERNTNPMTE
jgi:hypothetical protein